MVGGASRIVDTTSFELILCNHAGTHRILSRPRGALLDGSQPTSLPRPALVSAGIFYTNDPYLHGYKPIYENLIYTHSCYLSFDGTPAQPFIATNTLAWQAAKQDEFKLSTIHCSLFTVH